MTHHRQRRDAELLAALDALLGREELAGGVRVVRSYLAVLERRLDARMRPLDLFTLPHDLPTWSDLYADLVARAITETASITKAAEVIGVSRATLYTKIHKGILDEHAANDPELARVLRSVLGTATDA